MIGASPAAEARLQSISGRIPGLRDLFADRPAAAVRFQASGAGSLLAALPRARGADRTVSVELAARAGGVTRVTDERTGLSLAFTLADAADVAPSLAGELLLRAGAAPGGGDLLHRVDASGVEDLAFYDRTPEREELRYQVDVRRVAGLRLVAHTLEFLDEGGAPRLRVAPPFVLDHRGVRVAAALDIEGCAVDTSARGPWGRPVTPPGSDTCTVRVFWSGARVSYPALVDPYWQTTGQMAVFRARPTATALIEDDPTGEILVAGGFDAGGNAVASAELYEPLTRTFSATGSMSVPRGGHTATRLDPGVVFLAGGSSSAAGVAMALTELYDQTTGQFTTRLAMSTARLDHTATRLIDGRVLIAGGGTTAAVAPLNTFVVYDPTANTYTGEVAMPSPRRAHAATLLDDGTVLLSGGFVNTQQAAQFLAIYTPQVNGAGSVAAAHNMIDVRAFHTATLLNPGSSPSEVLLAGGVNATTGAATYQNSAELYTRGTSTQTPLPNMSARRARHTATRLASGDVLIAGGSDGTADLSTADLFRTQAHSFASVPSMSFNRQQHDAVLSGSGQSAAAGLSVLVVGGIGAAGPTAEILLKDLGDACVTPDECLSGFCSGGVCCDEACTAECYACTEADKEVGMGNSASGYCGPAKAGTPREIHCYADTHVEIHNVCDGAGNVEPGPGTKPCFPGTCGSNDRCIAYCLADADCASNAWCDLDAIAGTGGGGGAGGTGGAGGAGGTAGEGGTGGAGGAGGIGGGGGGGAGGSAIPPGAGLCAAKRNLGAQCSTNVQCLFGFCVDGVCCDSACTGSCQACNLPNTPGECTPVGTPANPLPVPDGHPSCGGDGACAGRCTGQLTAECTFPGQETLYQDPQCSCEDADCTGGATLTVTRCDGAGALAPETSRCGDRIENGETVPGGFRCEGASSCKSSCAADADCITDFICQDGVCLDLNVTGPSCDGEHTLRVAAAADQDCSPYRCPAGGAACPTTCQSVNDCVAGKACNAAGECVDPPEAPTVVSCSCRLPGSARDDASPAGTGLALAGLALAAAASRRRRRAR